MTALVASETILLALLLVLVAGLLRSHAEILRRLGPPDEARADADTALPEPPTASAEVLPPAPIAGTTLEGDAVKVTLGPTAPPTLVAFLTSGCGVCGNFWEGLRSGRPAALGDSDLRVVVVTRDTSHESPSRLAELRPPELPLIMSSAAWQAYRVPAAPYFVFVDSGVVRGEGSATTWKQIGSLLRDAEHDARRLDSNERTDAIDDVLGAAGITAGHPSLYPVVQHHPAEKPA
jgi:hypothetical protein